MVFGKSTSNRNEENRSKNEQGNLFRSISLSVIS